MKAIEKFYSIACDEASMEVERLARKVLKRHKELDEFVMGMGRWLFTLKIGAMDQHGIPITSGNEIIHDHDDPRFSEISDFIDSWDDKLKITGDSMRFTATGPKVTDW